MELEIDIAAPPEQVFRTLLDPDKVSIWMEAGAPEIDTESGRYCYGWHRGDPPVPVGPARIVEIVPDRLLVHDGQWIDAPDGQVRWELSPIDIGTRLRLIQTNTRDLTHKLGWSDALVSIRRLVVA